jgi:hypothetical protein
MSVQATHWAWDLLEQDLVPDMAGFVLVAIADFADADGHCWPSQARIMKRTKKSERTVRNALKWLEDHDLLHREAQWRHGSTATVGTDSRGRLPDAIWLHVGTVPTEQETLPGFIDPEQTMQGRVFGSKPNASQKWEQEAWSDDTPPAEPSDDELDESDDDPQEPPGEQANYRQEVPVIDADDYRQQMPVIIADQPAADAGYYEAITGISRHFNRQLTTSPYKEEPSINHQSIPVAPEVPGGERYETGVAGLAPPASGLDQRVSVDDIDDDLVDSSMPDALWAALDAKWTQVARRRLRERLAAGWDPDELYAALNHSLDAATDVARVVTTRVKQLPLSPSRASMPGRPVPVVLPVPEPVRDPGSYPSWVQARSAALVAGDPLGGKPAAWWKAHWAETDFATTVIAPTGGE